MPLTIALSWLFSFVAQYIYIIAPCCVVIILAMLAIDTRTNPSECDADRCDCEEHDNRS